MHINDHYTIHGAQWCIIWDNAACRTYLKQRSSQTADFFVDSSTKKESKRWSRKDAHTGLQLRDFAVFEQEPVSRKTVGILFIRFLSVKSRTNSYSSQPPQYKASAGKTATGCRHYRSIDSTRSKYRLLTDNWIIQHTATSLIAVLFIESFHWIHR